jgi:hypothetical protein
MLKKIIKLNIKKMYVTQLLKTFVYINFKTQIKLNCLVNLESFRKCDFV